MEFKNIKITLLKMKIEEVVEKEEEEKQWK